MPEQALAIYASAIPTLLRAGQEQDAEIVLTNYVALAFLLGQEQAALTFARRQKLSHRREQLMVSSLEATLENEVGATAALQQYAQANPDVPPAVIDRRKDWNTALLALRRADSDAAKRALPNLRASSVSGWGQSLVFFVRGRLKLLVLDYRGAERDFRMARAFVRFFRQWPQVSLVEHLSDF